MQLTKIFTMILFSVILLVIANGCDFKSVDCLNDDDLDGVVFRPSIDIIELYKGATLNVGWELYPQSDTFRIRIADDITDQMIPSVDQENRIEILPQNGGSNYVNRTVSQENPVLFSTEIELSEDGGRIRVGRVVFSVTQTEAQIYLSTEQSPFCSESYLRSAPLRAVFAQER